MLHTVFGGEWVKTTGLSSKFDVRSAVWKGGCEICHRGTMGPLWYSIKRHVVRCLTCYKPEELR